MQDNWNSLVSNIFNPVFFLDLVRTARRGRPMVLRSVYAGALLIMIFWAYCSWFAERGGGMREVFGGGSLRFDETPQFATHIFNKFMVVQFAVVLLLTPLFTAGAIAEEKDRRTLDFLLTTHLQNHEIVLGKLVSRLAGMFMVILTGLPVLGFIQLLGGVDPNQLLVGFAMTLLTMLSLGSLSIYLSIRSPRPLDAIFATYFWTALYLVVSPCAPIVNLGNPVLLFFLSQDVWTKGNPLQLTSIDILFVYTLFHGTITILCLRMSIKWFRFWNAEAASPKKTEKPSRFENGPRRPLPPVFNRPILWKELEVDHDYNFNSRHLFVMPLAIIVAHPVILTLVNRYSETKLSLSEQMNGWMRLLGTPLCCIMFFAVAFSAAGKISREREQRTLDSLLTTPLDRFEILCDKWLGSILCMRWLCLGIGSVWLMGFLTGGLHILAVFSLLLACVVYVAFLAALGMYFSTTCPSTLRATLFTFLAFLVVTVGPWLVGVNSRFLLAPLLPPSLSRWAVHVQEYGLMPPMTLTALSFNSEFFRQDSAPATRENISAAFTGLFLYALATALLWMMTWKRFCADTNSLAQNDEGRHDQDSCPA